MSVHRQVFPRWEVHPGGRPEGRFVLGDAAQAAKALQEQWAGRVRTVYLDPPFMSGGNYKFAQRVGEAGWKGDVKSQLLHQGYADRRRGGQEAYIAALEEVVKAAVPLLTEDGSLFLHVDWRTSAPVRLMLDRVMGRGHFVNEIIWSYQSGGRSQNHFSRKHDTIYYYRKGNTGAFYPDAVGVRRGREPRNHLKRSQDEQGRVYFSIRINGKEYRYYEDDLIYPGDVWTDIPVLQQKDPERTGYDTQKPEALLSRILRATTLPGDAVCDLFSGSGTAAAVAAAEGRIPLACDQSPFAAHLFRRRVSARSGAFRMQLPELPELPQDREVRLDVTSQDGGHQVELVLYDGPEAAPFAPPRTLLYRRDTLVDYWAVGRRQGDTFRVEAVQMRTNRQPVLGGVLTLPPGQGAPCVHIVDILGQQYFFDLT